MSDVDAALHAAVVLELEATRAALGRIQSALGVCITATCPIRPHVSGREHAGWVNPVEAARRDVEYSLIFADRDAWKLRAEKAERAARQ